MSKINNHDLKTENSPIITKFSTTISPENLWFSNVFRGYRNETLD